MSVTPPPVPVIVQVFVDGWNQKDAEGITISGSQWLDLQR